MQDVDFSGNATVSQIAERLKNSARVDIVYGEERKIGDKTIIPIAVVAYCFRRWRRRRTLPRTRTGRAARRAVVAVAAGGGVRVQPVAVLEVTGDDTRVLPVLDWTRIITTGITIFGAWMLVRSLFRRGPLIPRRGSACTSAARDARESVPLRYGRQKSVLTPTSYLPSPARG